MDRSLLSAEGLAQLLPDGEAVVGDAIKLHGVSFALHAKSVALLMQLTKP